MQQTLPPSTAPPTNAGPRQWWGLIILALPCLLYSMDLTVLYLAVPHITADLQPSSVQLLWIVDIYGFLLAGALVTMGAIGDRIGRRRLLMIGAIAFGLASAFAAFSATASMLIASRAMLGLAAATLAPSTLSLIRIMFADERQRGFAIGIWTASFSVGGAIGPLVGGLLLEYFWWGSVFLVSIPVMVMLLVLGPLVLPEHREPSGDPIDVVSAGLSIAMMLALVYGIKHVALGNISSAPVGSLVVAVVLGWAFMMRQKQLSTPLIDVDLFRVSGFTGALTANFTGFFLAFGSLFFVAQYLQFVLGKGAFEAGLWTLPSATGFVAGALIAPWLARWMHASALMAASLVAAAAGFALLAAALFSGSFSALITASVIFSIGLAPVFALATHVMVDAAPEEKSGSAAAIAETSSELGGALGIAVLGSIVAALYQKFMAAQIPPNVESKLATRLEEGIGSAVAALAGIDPERQKALHEVVFGAFTHAFASVALISLALALLAALAARLLR